MHKKSIEFKYSQNESVLSVINNLKKVLNVRYHHHYIKSNGIAVLEYFEISI